MTTRDPDGTRHKRILGNGHTECGLKPAKGWVGAPTEWTEDCSGCFGPSHGSAFTGIGGIDLALERAGFNSAWQIEIDKAARSVLDRHWKEVPKHDDITRIPDLPRVRIFSGGVPCQDWSVAGRRRGMAGARSGLFFDFARCADRVSSRWVLFENVPGLLSACSCPECNAPAREEDADGEDDEERQRIEADRDARGHRGHDFATVLGELTGFFPDPPDGGWKNSGFIVGPKRSAAWRVLDAQYFGVAQRRRRVFVVADSRGGSGPAEVLLESESVSGDPPPSRETGEASSRGFEVGPGGNRLTDLAPTLDARAKDGPIRNQLGVGVLAAVRRLTPMECERLQGFPDGWTDHQKDGARYKQLGNAVAVPVVEWIGRKISALEGLLPKD